MRDMNVTALAALIATTQQDHPSVPGLVKVDTIAGTMMDSQLADPLSHGGNVAWESFSQAVDSGNNSSFSGVVLQPGKPMFERTGLDFFHRAIVV